MSENTDSTFVVEKRRRRSSLFVERCPNLHNDGSDTETTNPSSDTSQTIVQLKNCVTQLKTCKKSWLVYEKKLLNSLSPNHQAADAKVSSKYKITEDNYLDYLDEEDRAFMTKMTSLQDSADEKKIGQIKGNLEVLSLSYENDKRKCATIFENVCRAHRKLVSQNIRQLTDVPDILNRIDLTNYGLSDQSRDVLTYNSDLED